MRARSFSPPIRAFFLFFFLVLASGSLPAADESRPRVLLIQIDGLSRPQFERALRDGSMPFLRSLLKDDRLRLHSLYSGLPSTTAGMQGELLYGVKTAVPAYGFKKRTAEQILRMTDLRAARLVEAELESQGTPLLKGGSVYASIYTGGAAESYFCAAAVRHSWDKVIFFTRWFGALTLRYPFHAAAGMGLTALELVRGTAAFLRGTVVKGMNVRQEFYFIFARAVISVWLREVAALGARRDMRLGVPVILVNFLGYDEAAHRRGPSAAYAHRFLPAIDRKIARLHRIAEKRGYTVYIFSDHGQEDALPYPDLGLGDFPDIVETLAAKLRGTEDDGVSLELIFVELGEWTKQMFGVGVNVLDEAGLSLVAMGPLAHVYLSEKRDGETLSSLARQLVARAKVPVVFVAEGKDRAQAYTEAGILELPDDIEKLVGEHPFREKLASDLIQLCHHPDAGRLILAGWARGREPISLASENGAHGGLAPEETHAFVLLPPDVPPPSHIMRPLDLRKTVQRALSK